MNPTALMATPSAWHDTVAAPATQGQSLPLPAIEQRWRYGWHYWTHATRARLAPHRLRPDAVGRYETEVVVSPALREQWAELFDLRRGPGGVTYPFLYMQATLTLLQGRVMADLGVNVRHVSHLRQGLRLVVPAAQFVAVERLRLHTELRRAVRVGPTEVLAIVVTGLTGPDGQALGQVEDSFIVRGLEVAYAVQADEDDALRRAVSRLRRRVAEIDALDSDTRSRHLYLAPDAIRRYARVAGDHGPLFERGSALLPGRRRPSAQSLYLRHLVVRELAEWGLCAEELQVVFVARARVGQTLKLLERGGRFELLDEAKHLIAYGKC